MTATPYPGAGCPDYETLKACVDGELAPGECRAAEAHVEGCASCAREVEMLRRIGEGVRALGAAEPPARLRERILARCSFAAEVRRSALGFDLLRWGALTGGVCVLLYLIVAPIFMQARESARSTNARVPRGRAQLDSAEPAPAAGSGPAADESARRMFEPGQASLPAGTPGVTPDDVERYTRGAAVEDPSRKVVQTADLSVRVRRPLEAVQDEVAARIKRDGGYAEESSLTAPESGTRSAAMTLRVPVARFEATVAYLSGLGEVAGKNVRGEDVTGTWIDQRSTVRALRQTEERLSEDLRQAKSEGERLRLRQELLAARERITVAEERFAFTGKLAALATVRLTLLEAPGPRAAGGSLLWDLQDSARAASAALVAAVRVPLTLLIWLGIFSPLWLPCLLVYRWASRMVRPRPESLYPDPQC
jgi:hypothetical protein